MQTHLVRADSSCSPCSLTSSTEGRRLTTRTHSVAMHAFRRGKSAAQHCQLITCHAAADMEELAPAERLQRSPEASSISNRDTVERDTDGEAASREFAVAMAKLTSDTKAGEISVLHVAPLIYWTSYMVIVSVYSRPQLNAILGKMEKEAAEVWNRHLSGEANGRSPWEVLDYGDVVVHIFTPEMREFYDLEGFYGAAEEIDLPFVREEQGMQWSRKL